MGAGAVMAILNRMVGEGSSAETTSEQRPD